MSRLEAAKRALKTVLHPDLHPPILAALDAEGLLDKPNGAALSATSTTAPADARRLARFDSNVEADTAEMRNTFAELKRLSVPFNRKDGVDLVALRAAADKQAFTAQQKIRLLTACANIGLAE
jgi:anti-sigma factor RsiW